MHYFKNCDFFFKFDCVLVFFLFTHKQNEVSDLCNEQLEFNV